MYFLLENRWNQSIFEYLIFLLVIRLGNLFQKMQYVFESWLKAKICEQENQRDYTMNNCQIDHF